MSEQDAAARQRVRSRSVDQIADAYVALRQGGDESVTRALNLLHNVVFGFSMKVCGHREDAEDTAQETLLRTTPMLHKITSPEALSVWLYKVARSRCLMSRRRSKFAPTSELSLDALMPDQQDLKELLAAPGASAEAKLLVSESAEQLRAALDRLPPQYRFILILHDMEELGTDEVARITGLRPGTVRVRLHRARLFLRKELARKVAGAAQPKKPVVRDERCRALFAEFSEYLDQRLTPELCRQLERHMSDCAPCRAFLESLYETVERCRRFDPAGRKACAQRAMADLRAVLPYLGR
jgi:RNA polymerase sigma-70 factor, ECF subfamily